MVSPLASGAGIYLDPDALLRKYGTRKAVPNTAGEFKTYGELRTVEVTIPLVQLTPFGTNLSLSDQTFMPANAFIEEVDVMTDVAAGSLGAATLNVGLIRTDRTTVVNATGFVSALALANINAAGRTSILTLGSAGAGALIGTVLANPGYLIGQAGAAVYNAGTVRIEIKYYML